MTSAETYLHVVIMGTMLYLNNITDEVMSDLSDLFHCTHLVCYRQFCQTHVHYCRQVQPQCMRACADDDEIILGIIALVVVKSE